jgi:hypothetical protein
MDDNTKEQETLYQQTIQAGQAILINNNTNQELSNKPKLPLIIKIILIIITIIVSFVLITSIFIGASVVYYCNKKEDKLNIINDAVNDKLQSIEGATNIVTNVNGDCLTGVGSNFSFTYRQPFDNTKEAIISVFSTLKDIGFDLPNQQESFLIGSRADNSSGGDNAIKQVYVQYNNYRFTIELDQPIDCEYKPGSGEIYCNSIKKDELEWQIFENQPIDELTVSGLVYSIQ